MNRLYLMCGLAFSGKSTLARAMSESLQAPVISLDAINRRRGLGRDGQAVPDAEWAKTHRMAKAELGTAMRFGQDVIVDDTNCFRWLRDGFRTIADANGYATTVVYLQTGVDVAMERLIANEKDGTRPGLPRDYFRSHAESFEPPAADEACLVFAPSMDPARWMRDHGIGPEGPDNGGPDTAREKGGTG